MGLLYTDPADPASLSTAALAFLGDAVYGLLVREMLASASRQPGVLHKRSVEYVNASAQAKGIYAIMDRLTEKEMGIYKRGRNIHTSNTPKGATEAEYHAATGLEALFGYLYVTGQNNRLRELFLCVCRLVFGNNSE